MNVQNVRAKGEPRKASDIDAIAASNRLPEIARLIRSEHQATSAALSSAVIHAMAAGDLLIEAKAAVPHGQWLPWLADNCTELSERTVQLYMKLAKHRATIEKEIAKSAMGVADLTLNEAAALCVLAGRIDKLMEFAKRAEVTSGDDLIDLCTSYGFGVIADEGYDPFFHCDETGKHDRCCFMLYLVRHWGWKLDSASPHVEYLLQKQFKSPDEWLGEEGSKFRRICGQRRDPSKKFKTEWAQFLLTQADRKTADIEAELTKIADEERDSPW
jgi:hypothetical protein